MQHTMMQPLATLLGINDMAILPTLYIIIAALSGGYHQAKHQHEQRNGINDVPVFVATGFAAAFWPIYLSSLVFQRWVK